MLFDLRGRRRRVVQATYLTLAILMGGGLVLFGVGSDVQGGLADIFKGEGGGDQGNETIQKRVDKTEERLARDPDNPVLLKELVRDNYSLATSQAPSGSTGFPKDARDELQASGAAWQRYLKAEKGEPDSSLAGVALQVYDVTALNQPKRAQEAAAIVAKAENDTPAYLRLVQYATLAGDKRTADLAGQKAVDLAPKGQKKAVKEQLKQAKALSTQSATPGQ